MDTGAAADVVTNSTSTPSEENRTQGYRNESYEFPSFIKEAVFYKWIIIRL
jgi:hypothetical protein